MKSLFSCILRKKGKPKKDSIENLEEKVVTNHISIVETSPNEVPLVENHVTKENCVEIIKEKEVPKEDTQIEDRKREEENRQRNALIYRLNSALSRIENVSLVLNKKYSYYSLPNVLSQFDDLCGNELQNFLLESESLEFPFAQQAELVQKLFHFHKTFLTMISSRSFDNLSQTVVEFRTIVVQINEVCNNDSILRDLNRLIADSILIFGWLCVLERPAKFIQNNLDGYLINITRLLNDRRFLEQCNWLKSWAVVLKRFSSVISQNFQAALMWGVPGPVPTDLLQCLIECNYSRDEHAPVKSEVRKKVIKTTTVENMSCESMTSLMDDLRSGRHKSRLRPVGGGQHGPDEPPSALNGAAADPDTETAPSRDENQTAGPGGCCRLDTGAWIVENLQDQSDIEISNRTAEGRVVIRNCQNCSVQVSGTVQSLAIERCTSLNVIMDDVTGPYNLTDCSNIECQVFGLVGKVNLEGVSQFRLFLGPKAADQMELDFRRSSEIALFISKSEDVSLELDDYTQLAVETSCRSSVEPHGLSSSCF